MQLRTARIAHEVNKAYCASHGDTSQSSWDNAPQWQKDSALLGVKFHMSEDKTPEQSHESWLAQKEKDGWVYGETKDAVAKTHPCMIPYAQLPPEQRVKDYLFKAVVDSMKPTQNKVEYTHIQNLMGKLTFRFERVAVTTVTGCWAFLPLPNGGEFQVGYGESACVDPAEYKQADGEKYAMERCMVNAQNKLWELEGYLLAITGTTSDQL